MQNSVDQNLDNTEVIKIDVINMSNNSDGLPNSE